MSKNDPEVVEQPTEEQISQEEQLKAQSSHLGKNMQAFLDQVNMSAKSEEDRRVLNVYADVMSVVEKMIAGELILVNAQSIFPPAAEEPAEDVDPAE